jgi:surfactin synthase thioesterase subunit
MTELWFRQYPAAGVVRHRLICFPHAGGAASAYRTWSQHLPPDVQVCAVRYPGHHDRLDEPCHRRMARLVEDLCEAITPLLDVPVSLFGHSMGASVAFETARALQQLRGRAPAAVFVSGSRAPHQLPDRNLHMESDEALIAYATRLGGVDPVVLDDRDLRAMLLPTLRADHEILATYRPAVAPGPVAAPLVAYVGDQDPEVSPGDMLAWSALTSETFHCRVYPGGHFYLTQWHQALLGDLTGHLRGVEVS